MAISETLPRGAAVGRYLVLERIGAGGMGVVYTAYDPHLDRRIALKLVHSRRGNSAARLLREARLMAQVSHPDVISVYDVGLLGEQVFIAMEYVEGKTLKAWLKERPRSPAEVVSLFVRAGRGLAAAHAAEVVHRDFKPDNVLVGSDGRVRVTDFGVARLAFDEDTAPMPAPDPPLYGDTTSGAMVGSPRYMAPEQIDGKDADARSDVFSFSVALYEALYGETPFAGDDLFQRRAAIAAGTVREPPKGSAVPGWLRRAVLGGLRADPAQRYGSMEEMLAALSRDPARQRRRALLAGGAVAAVALLVALGVRGRSSVCKGAELRLAGIWDGARRAALQKALAPEQWPGVSRLLSAYAQSWTAMRTEACEATRVRGEQSEQLLDLRMECLDRKLADLGALSDLLASGSPQPRAVDAAAALPSLQECANAAALRERAPLPEDADSRRRIAELRATLAKASALVESGDDARALALAKPLQSAASAAGYKPLAAEAQWVVARAITQAGDLRAAEAATHRAALDAERARDDMLASRAWISLAWSVGHREGRGQEGRIWADYAGAALDRAGGDDRLDALRLRAVGFIDLDEGRLEEALSSFRRAQALLEAQKDQDEDLYGMVLEGLGIVLDDQGKLEEALPVKERVLAIDEKVLGPGHPHVAFAEDQLAETLMLLGRPAEALEHARRGLAVRERALPPDSPFIAFSHSRIGYALHALHRDGEALEEHRRALEIGQKRLGTDSRDLTFSLQGMGEDLRALGRPGEAVAPLTRALALREKYRVDPGQLADTRFELAQALWESSQDRKRARELASAAAVDYLRALSQGERDASARGQLVSDWLAKR